MTDRSALGPTPGTPGTSCKWWNIYQRIAGEPNGLLQAGVSSTPVSLLACFMFCVIPLSAPLASTVPKQPPPHVCWPASPGAACQKDVLGSLTLMSSAVCASLRFFLGWALSILRPQDTG